MISQEVQPDHIHLFLSIPPSTSVAEAAKIIKGTAARKLLARFPVLRERFRNLWSPSYYVGTAGRVRAETMRHHLQRTKHSKERE